MKYANRRAAKKTALLQSWPCYHYFSVGIVLLLLLPELRLASDSIKVSVIKSADVRQATEILVKILVIEQHPLPREDSGLLERLHNINLSGAPISCVCD